jgi:hypothetical protein
MWAAWWAEQKPYIQTLSGISRTRVMAGRTHSRGWPDGEAVQRGDEEVMRKW